MQTMSSNTEQNMFNLHSNRIPVDLFDEFNFRKVLKLIERRALFAKYSQEIIDYKPSSEKDIKDIIESIITSETELQEFIKILLFTGLDNIAEQIDPNVKDLYDLKLFGPKSEQKFQFNYDPKDELENREFSSSSGVGLYLMFRSPRGYCFLVNNFFTEGTHEQMKRLRNIFYQLHFDVQMYKNLSIKQLTELLIEYSNDPKLSEHDAFVFIILTFGNDNKEILDFNNNKKGIKELTQLVNDENCPEMKGKPRLFIFNCCNSLVDVHDQEIENKRSKSSIEPFPNNEDVFICHSTYDCTGAINWKEGTYFGKALADSLVKKAYYKDLNSIITRLKTSLDIMFKDITKEKKLIEWNTMNRVLYFLPETPEKRPYFSRLTISTIKTAQSLDKYIKTSGQSLKIDELTEIILQMIESLQTLHSGNLSCGHINPKSFQVSIPDFNGKIKVIIEGKFEVKTIQNKAITSSMNTEYRCWISPEALQSLENGHNFEVTKENDVFSMGCVIYFVLTRGEHPFAFNEKNIMKNNFNLSGIKGDENQIYVDLIESMINNKKAERPSIEVVLKHPMFWKPEKVLQFYTDIKNLFHAENEKVMETPGFRNIQEEVKTKMKEESNAIFGGNWFNLLCDELKTYEDQKPNHRIKDKTSFVKLLDYIRDKNQHYDEWPQNIKNIFGSTNGSYLEYFKQRFPLLLITTYKIMKVMKAERKLDLYY